MKRNNAKTAPQQPLRLRSRLAGGRTPKEKKEKQEKYVTTVTNVLPAQSAQFIATQRLSVTWATDASPQSAAGRFIRVA